MSAGEDVSAGALLRRSAETWPNRVAVIDGSETPLSYRDLDRRATGIAEALRRRGLVPGSRLAILSGNCIDYAALIFGAARAGVVLVHLSLRASGQELGSLLRRGGARMLLLGPAAPDAANFADSVEGLAVHRLAELRDSGYDGQIEADHDEPRSDLPYAMTFTGGTTGMPKGVIVSHRGRAGQARIIAQAFGMHADDVIAVATPMFHVAGLFVWFQPAIAAGATCVLLGAWDVNIFADMVERHRVTATMLVPTQLIDLLRRGQALDRQLASLQRIVYAGAPMPRAVLEELLQRFPWIEFIENYGQSELGAVTVRRGADLPAKAGSVGRALPGLELAVMRPDGTQAPHGEAGELVCRGGNQLLAYDGDAAASAALYPYGGNWLATGDIATIDHDGFVTLVDRAKDMIICGGENIYPAEIENALHRHGDVAECAVVGQADGRLGEVPVAFVVLRAGGKASADDFIAFCLGQLPRYKRPRTVHFVDSLPKTAIGKIQKNQLREALATGSFHV